MTTPVFPSTLPGVSTLSWAPSDQVLSTEAEIGPIEFRRTTRVPGADADVSWRFLDNDFSTFQEFYTTTLIRGHRWFKLILPCAGGYVAHVVRFKKHRTAKRDGYGFRTVSAQLEVRERRFGPDIAYTWFTTTLYPVDVVEGVNAGYTMLAGAFSQLQSYAIPLEGTDMSYTVVSGDLSVKLQTNAIPFEGTDNTYTILSGSLVSALRTTNMGIEGVDMSFTIFGGYLKAILIVNAIPMEGVDMNYTMLSGSLA